MKTKDNDDEKCIYKKRKIHGETVYIESFRKYDIPSKYKVLHIERGITKRTYKGKKTESEFFAIITNNKKNQIICIHEKQLFKILKTYLDNEF